MEEIKIREANLKDAPAIAKILRDLAWFPDINNESEKETVKHVKTNLKICIRGKAHSVFVAEVNNNIVGYVTMHWSPYIFLTSPEGLLSELFIITPWRGKGIGNLLNNYIIEEGRKRGCSRLTLVNGRERDSYKTNFYQKRGWVERDNVANFVYKY